MQKKTLQKTLSGSAKKSRQTTGEESRRSAQQSTQSGGARATYTSLPTKEKAEYVRDLTERYYRSQRAAETAARRTESAVRSGGAGSSTHYSSSGRAHGGSSGSFGTALGYGEAIGGGIEAGLWNGGVAGPLNLVASKVGQKISSSDTDTWLGKTSFQKEHEITAAFLGRLGSVWDGYELGDGSFSQKLKDTAFAGYNSAFQNFLEGAGRRPGLFPGGESREALYLGSNALFHALKEYALPAITGSHDKEYNARWLTGKAYEAVDKLTDKASSVPGRKYFNSKIYQKDLEASSPSVRLAGKVSQSVANMLPSIAVSLATESPDAALLALSASAAGNAAKEAYESGATPEQAYYIGLEKGYVEYLTSGMFDALGVFGGGKLTPGMKSLLGEYASSKGGRGLIKIGGILGENVEEGVSDWSETGIERAVLGHTIGGKEDKTLAQALAGQAPWTEDGLVTLLSTLALNGGEQITNRLQSSVDKAASAKQQAAEAAYLRRMEEIGHLRPEGKENAALDRVAEEARAEKTAYNSSLQGQEESGIIRKTFASGALDFDSKEAESHAEMYYESVRHMKTDAKRIAKNTGLTEQDITAIKQFLFEEQHDLEENGIRRFFADYDIAQSWQRLIDGKDIQPHDLTLLRHELLERQLMLEGKTQREAHKEASAVYNYKKECDEFHDRTKKHKKG